MPPKTSWLSREKRSGMFDMDSTPPATIASASPAAIMCCASTIDCSPDPQSRFTVNAGTRSGTPARSAATRATLTASGGCAMLPTMTSSSSAGSNPVRARSSAMTTRPRSAAPRFFSSVPAREYGVLSPSTTTTSRDMRLSGRCVHALDEVAVTRLDRAPLDLQSRRHRAVLDRQLGWQEREGADLLVVRPVGVVRVDLPLEHGADLGVRVDRLPADAPVARGRPVLE